MKLDSFSEEDKKELLKEALRENGSINGKKSAKVRFKNLNKKQISERMKEIRSFGKQKEFCNTHEMFKKNCDFWKSQGLLSGECVLDKK